MARQGRPGALGDDIARPRLMAFRLSEEELKHLRLAAARAGLPVGAYIVATLKAAGALGARINRLTNGR